MQRRGATRPPSTPPLLMFKPMTREEITAVMNAQRQEALRGPSRLRLFEHLRSQGRLSPSMQSQYRTAVKQHVAHMPTLYNRQLKTYVQERDLAAAAMRGRSRTNRAVLPLLQKQQALYLSLMKMKPRGAAAPPPPLSTR